MLTTNLPPPSSSPSSRPLIYLATSTSFPTEPCSTTLLPALAALGLDARWATWSDPSVPWSAASLVLLRSTWDYHDRLPDFLAWADSLGPKLFHDPQVIRWNTDKKYLLDLEAKGIPVVPTFLAEDLTALRDALTRAGKFEQRAADGDGDGDAEAWHHRRVVKPAVGASGDGVQVVELFRAPTPTPTPTAEEEEHDGDGEPRRVAAASFDDFHPDAPAGPWVVQPFVGSVLTEGETSVFAIDGTVTAQTRKRATAAAEFRVHEERGGSQVTEDVGAEARALVESTVAAVEELLAEKWPLAGSEARGRRIGYARFDLLRWRGALVVSEVEVTEPMLYFDRHAGHSERFAEMVARLVREREQDGV